MTVLKSDGAPSLEGVFRDHYPQLWRLAALMVGDPARAEELVMDAFARALRDSRKHAIRDSPAGYLRVAVINRCRDHLRRRSREWRVNELHAAQATVRASQPHAGIDPTVLAAVQSLPPRQRAVVVLTYFDDLAEVEVARALGIAQGTVKSQLHKAKRTLSAILKENQ